MIIKTFLIYLFLLASAFTVASESDREYYYTVNKIYGFTLLDSKIHEVFEYFGLKHPTLHEEKHELAEACIRNNDASLGLVLITGVIHDYETLYGYRLTSKPKEDCLVSEKITSENSGVIPLGSNGSKIVKTLGGPNSISSEEANWKLKLTIPWGEPIVRSWKAGPEGKKYTQVQTISGEHHTVLIGAKFTGDYLTEFEVIDYAESDFKIENVYDQKI